MRFDSWSAFILMDGHGVYIWLAYGVTFLILTANLWIPRLMRMQFVKQQQAEHVSAASAVDRAD